MRDLSDIQKASILSGVEGYLLKYTKNGTGKPHRRYVKLHDNGVLEWNDSDMSNRSRGEKICGLMLRGDPDFPALHRANDEILHRSFAVRTSSRSVSFTADTVEDFSMWKSKIRDMLARQQS